MTRVIITGLFLYASYCLLTYSRQYWYTDTGTYTMVGGMVACFLAGYILKEEN